MDEAAAGNWRRYGKTSWRDLIHGQLSKSDDYRRVITESDLPPPIMQVVDDVVRRTRLWSGEKCDVAAELCAHFEDGLQVGHTVEELQHTFGWPADSAKLIRRAKIRCRPMPWHFWRRTWPVAVVSLLVLFTLQHPAQRQRRAVAALRNIGADVQYDYEAESGVGSLGTVSNNQVDLLVPRWLTTIVGKESFGTVAFLSIGGRRSVTPAQYLSRLSGLPGLNTLMLSDDRIQDSDLRFLVLTPQLSSLWLNRLQVGDAACQQIASLQDLEVLEMNRSGVTDEGVLQLVNLPKLRQLGLAFTEVTDAAIPHLKTMKSLDCLNIKDTRISDAGAAELKQAFPNCLISH